MQYQKNSLNGVFVCSLFLNTASSFRHFSREIHKPVSFSGKTKIIF